MSHTNRRAFLADVGNAMLAAGIGTHLAAELGASTAWADEDVVTLTFGPKESLVALMQQTPPEKLLPQLVQRLNSGTSLTELLGAGALANARSFGGQDYIGFHTFMALCPAGEMARELPEREAALPVLKVLYRNAGRMQATGGREHEVLHPVSPSEGPHDSDKLHAAELAGDMEGSERIFAAMMQDGALNAYNQIQPLVEDEEDVHRVVLAWRAWDTLDLTGPEHAHTLLRQSVRYCVDVEKRRKERGYGASAIREILPKLLDQYHLIGRPIGTRMADDAWIASFSETIYAGTRAEAAEATAAALAEGFSAAAIGEAISLAATKLVLFDPGREEKYSSAEKPPGCVHGDSVGVHASDAASAWRSIASVCNPRNGVASLIVAASHTAGQGSRQPKEPNDKNVDLAILSGMEPAKLLGELETAIRANDQARACAIVRCYGASDAAARPLLDQLLRHSIRADGALHAEKYYRTASTEFGRTRPAFRWQHLTALARVVASESGHAAPGIDESRRLLGLTADV